MYNFASNQAPHPLVIRIQYTSALLPDGRALPAQLS
jgi:hypothetical protein